MSDRLSRFICVSCRNLITDFTDTAPEKCARCGGVFRNLNTASPVHMTENYSLLQYDSIDSINEDVEQDWHMEEERKEFDAINKLRTGASGVTSNE